MTFRVRTLQEIIDGMLATILANSSLTDVNRGSIVRILVEAAALQDADQNLMVARLKQLFSIEAATGTDLDDRAADYDLNRLAPTRSTGSVRFRDSNFTTKVQTTLSALTGIGATVLTLTDASAFPTSGSVILERDTAGQREPVTYTSKAGNNLILSTPTTLSHAALTSVILSTVGADRVIPSGTSVYVPSTESVEQIDFTTQAAVTLLDGDITTADVAVLSVLTGLVTRVGSAQISGITGPPFPTATVTNDAPMQGGRDAETDDDFRQRIKQTIQALSNGTINDLLVAAASVTLTSGQRVIYAQVVEEFTDPDVSVYIDDGTGLVSTSASVTTNELLIHQAEPGQRRARLANWPVNGGVSLKKSVYRGGPGSALTISVVTPGVGTAVLTITGLGVGVNALVGFTLVDSNRNFYVISANTANDVTVIVPGTNPVPGSFAIFDSTFLVASDYLFNETTGDIELVTGLTLNDSLIAAPNPTNAYTYFTGLIREVQKVLNGDPDNLDKYPGVKAAGVKLKVRAPSVSWQTISVSVVSTFGTVEEKLVASVKDAVVAYVNGLGIGDDVILAEIIAAVMAIDGITDCSVNTPTANVVVLDGSLPRTKASMVTVL